MQGVITWVKNLFYSKLVGPVLPVRWFAPEPLTESQLTPAPKPPTVTLEIVAHCWQYSHLLIYQLSSLINYPPQKVRVIYTLYYAEEDAATVALINHVNQKSVPGVTWQWRPLSRTSLQRRAIGRHHAARSTQADWVWFTDCDLIFHLQCLDTLATSLAGVNTGLLYPDHEFITPLLPADHASLHKGAPGYIPADIDPELFSRHDIKRAKGAFQIVHGDVARHSGYCGTVGLYQTPVTHWRKTFEDTAFRNLIGFQGQPIAITGLYRFRHRQKGRYGKASRWSELRKRLRR